MDLHGKRVVVFGLAGSGRAACRLAVERGATVVGVDAKLDVEPIPGVMLELGPHRIETFTTADLIVVSPGIPGTAGPLVAAVQAGVRVLGEIHFAVECQPSIVGAGGTPAHLGQEFTESAAGTAAPTSRPVAIVAITGTNGKSTVTHFVGQILAEAGMRPFVGGNLGRALSEAAFAENAGQFGVWVVEVSSYQMEWPSPQFRPHAGVILNLTPDHLARHKTMENYAAHKARIFANIDADDIAVVPADDPLLNSLATRGTVCHLGALPGVIRAGDTVQVRIPGKSATFDLSAFQIPGAINKDNAATAALLALAMGADPEAIQSAIPKLQPLAHRMQIVARRDGITWIDDSKATNVAAAVVGIGGLTERGVVLLGGQAKGDPFAELAPLLAGWKVVTFGGDGNAIAAELAAVGVTVDRRCGPMAEAVSAARTLARPGDVILLSPGCASFDEFKNFEHRGDVFAGLARATAG